MKVLWFSLSPCGSIRMNNMCKTNQGWMVSLEDELKKEPDINLMVSFFSTEKRSPFYFEGVLYYPMFIGEIKNGLQRIKERTRSIVKKDEQKLSLMLDVVKESKPDIIHIHGTEESFGLILEHIKDIPVCISIQGMIAPYAEKYFSGLTLQQIKNSESLKSKITNSDVKHIYSNFCERARREEKYIVNAKYILGRTFWDKGVCMALNPNIKYFVVNEILRSQFYEHQWIPKKEVKHKIIITSIISPGPPYKGYETLLKTAKILKNFSLIDFQWNVIGYDNNNRWVGVTEKSINIFSKDVNVCLLGNKTADDMIPILLQSDIYIHVSHIENSPNSVCEAMLLGMPIIATYAGGTASLLTHEKDGILCQDGDPYVIAGSIIELIKNPTTAIDYAKSARYRAVMRHNRLNIVNEVKSAYKTILSDIHTINE